MRPSTPSPLAAVRIPFDCSFPVYTTGIWPFYSTFYYAVVFLEFVVVLFIADPPTGLSVAFAPSFPGRI